MQKHQSSVLTTFAVLGSFILPSLAKAQSSSFADNMNATQLLETYLSKDQLAVNAYGEDVRNNVATEQEYNVCTQDMADMTSFLVKTSSENPFADKARAYAIIGSQILHYYGLIKDTPCPKIEDFKENGKAVFLPMDPIKKQGLDLTKQVAARLGMTAIIFYQAARKYGYAQPADYDACVVSLSYLSGAIKYVAQEVNSPRGASAVDLSLANLAQTVLRKTGPDFCPTL